MSAWPPWRAGAPQAECAGEGCPLEPPRTCVASTMTAGRCRACVEAGRSSRVERNARPNPAALPAPAVVADELFPT